MANPETVIQQRIRLALAGQCPNVRLFRNECGVGYHIPHNELRKLDRKQIRRVSYGLSVGSPDLVGWRTITITSDMVGKQIAQFVGVEVKTRTGREADDQKRWRRIINDSGGHSVVSRSESEAVKQLTLPF